MGVLNHDYDEEGKEKKSRQAKAGKEKIELLRVPHAGCAMCVNLL